MPPVIEGLLTALAGFLAASSGFWVYLRNRAEIRDKAQDSTTRLLMGLAQEKIVYLGLKYIDRGFVTKDEYKDLRHYLYEPYIALGGNGTVERIMHGVERLEFRSNNPLSNIPIRGTDRDPNKETHFSGKERRKNRHRDMTKTDENEIERGNHD